MIFIFELLYRHRLFRDNPVSGFIVLALVILIGSIFFEKVPKEITDPKGLNESIDSEK